MNMFCLYYKLLYYYSPHGDVELLTWTPSLEAFWIELISSWVLIGKASGILLDTYNMHYITLTII